MIYINYISKFLVIIFIYFTCSNIGLSQSVKDYGINIRATLDTINRKVTFKWDADTNAYNFFIYKKKTSDSLFGDYIAKLPKDQLEWTDTLLENVEVEYKIEKDANLYFSYGYIIAGLNINEKDYFGTCLILVDSLVYPQITLELDDYVKIIRADGWRVIVKAAPRSDEFNREKVEITKSIIKQTYNEINDLAALLIIGRVPVPYSGNYAIDGHEDHYGAWPTDLYYAELNGLWTDTLRSKFDNVIPRAMNLPNDGKYDQLFLTSDVELQMGRIDLFNLPFFKESEVDLIKRYLNKVSEFRKGNVEISKRAGLIDNFGPGYREGFAANGWTNFYSLLGGDSVFYLKDRFELTKQDYLWYYGCGPGAYLACHEALYSEELAKSPHLAAFNMIFGSYNGDWDSENNLLRSAIAAQPLGYAALWAGRPFWFFHHLAYGYNIGYSTKLTQNAYPANYSAVSPFARRMNHIALQGDPTLRMSYFKKVDKVDANYTKNGIELKWDYQQTNDLTFNVYRAKSIDGKFELLQRDVKNNFFIDELPLLGTNIYQVRAKRKEIAHAGTYYNLSIGKFSEAINYPENYGIETIIAPNPFVDLISIIPKDNNEILKIELFDMNGLKIYEFYEKDYSNIRLANSGGESLSTGVYFIRIFTNEGYTDYKLIKE